MRLIYTAARPIVSAQDQLVELVIGARAVNPSERSVGRSVPDLDGGSLEILQSLSQQWVVETVALAPADADLAREFWRSTAAGETFTFDPYSRQAGVDDSPVLARRTDRVLALNRVLRTDKFRLRFTVRAV